MELKHRNNGETLLKQNLRLKVILEDTLKTLNNIPNHMDVGPNGQSSYEMASTITKVLKNE